MASILPSAITANRPERILMIQWNDEHTSYYPFGLVRAACPCASCRSGHENMSAEPDAEVFGYVYFLDRPLSQRPNKPAATVIAAKPVPA